MRTQVPVGRLELLEFLRLQIDLVLQVRLELLVRLEPLSGTVTVYTDQVELSAGPLTGAAALWTKLYLRRGQRRWKKELRAELLERPRA